MQVFAKIGRWTATPVLKHMQIGLSLILQHRRVTVTLTQNFVCLLYLKAQKLEQQSKSLFSFAVQMLSESQYETLEHEHVNEEAAEFQ